MLAKNEVRLARACYLTFRGMSVDAQDAFKKGGQIASEEVLVRYQDEFQKRIFSGYNNTASEIIPYTFSELGIGKKSSFQDIVRRHLEEESLKKAKMITDTSFGVMRKIIVEGHEKGVGTLQIAANIRSTFDFYSVSRSRTIARTEIHSAATHSMQDAAEEAAEQLDVQLGREWVTIEDDRTRDAHIDADEQKVGLDEPFYVDGEYIDVPGEGDAANAINCRCTVIYNPI